MKKGIFQNFKTSNQGFTLLELMITLGIVSVLSSVAVPTFHKHIRTAQLVESENLLAMGARDQLRVKQTAGVYSETFKQVSMERPQLDIGVTNAKYNVIVGGRNSGQPAAEIPSLDLLGNNGLPAALNANQFGIVGAHPSGVFANGGFVMGIESNPNADGTRMVMVIANDRIPRIACDGVSTNVDLESIGGLGDAGLSITCQGPVQDPGAPCNDPAGCDP